MAIATGTALAIGATAASAAGTVVASRNAAKAQEATEKRQLSSVANLQEIREGLVDKAVGGTFQGNFGLDDIFGRRPDEVNLGDVGRNAYQTNIQNLGLNQDLVSRANESISEEAFQRATRFDPNFRSNVRDLSNQARSLIRGEIPEDVASEIFRNRAGAAASGGVPGAQRAATARDLGLTSLDLQGRGTSLFTQINGIRDSIDPLSRQIGLNQLLVSPEQQLQADLANNVLRSAPDPQAQDLFNLELQGSREEAFARGNIQVPVNNTLGAGLSAVGGGLTGLVNSGAFSSFGGSSGPGYNPNVPIVQPSFPGAGNSYGY